MADEGYIRMLGDYEPVDIQRATWTEDRGSVAADLPSYRDHRLVCGPLIDAPVAFFQVFELIPPVVLITMIPISIAGWGVREATMGLAFGYAGLMFSEGVNVSLLFGAVYFLVGILGGLVWILSSEKADVAVVLSGFRTESLVVSRS